MALLSDLLKDDVKKSLYAMTKDGKRMTRDDKFDETQVGAAKKEGAKAASDGEKITSNPYPKDSTAYSAWNQGFKGIKDAEDESDIFTEDGPPDYYAAIVSVARQADNPRANKEYLRKNIEPIFKARGVPFESDKFEAEYKRFSQARMGREYEKSKDAAEEFREGEKVKINYGEHSGKTGTFVEYSPSGSFAIVKVAGNNVGYDTSNLKKIGKYHDAESNCTCEENMEDMKRAWYCPQHGHRTLTSSEMILKRTSDASYVNAYRVRDGKNDTAKERIESLKRQLKQAIQAGDSEEVKELKEALQEAEEQYKRDTTEDDGGFTLAGLKHELQRHTKNLKYYEDNPEKTLSGANRSQTMKELKGNVAQVQKMIDNFDKTKDDWSPEAREAAAEARRRNAKNKPDDQPKAKSEVKSKRPKTMAEALQDMDIKMYSPKGEAGEKIRKKLWETLNAPHNTPGTKEYEESMKELALTIKAREEKEREKKREKNKSKDSDLMAQSLFNQIKREGDLEDAREQDAEDFMSAYPGLSKGEAQKLYNLVQQWAHDSANPRLQINPNLIKDIARENGYNDINDKDVKRAHDFASKYNDPQDYLDAIKEFFS